MDITGCLIRIEKMKEKGCWLYENDYYKSIEKDDVCRKQL